MSTIYVFCAQMGREDFAGYALAEDGECIAGHISSSVEWSRHDMGLTSTKKHDAYRAKYPGGYELEWIDEADLRKHAGYQGALALNKARPDVEIQP
jgi:hypothetical protein